MFRSIRWRLVLSYTLLALLTVTLVGILALSLVRHYIGQQETKTLTANAGAVASQAESLLWPVVRPQALQELARTSASLGNARVRILDEDMRVLADSASSGRGDEAAWLILPLEWQFSLTGDSPWPFTVELPHGGRIELPPSREEQAFIFQQLPPETQVTLLRMQEGAWGDRLHFEVIEEPAELQRMAPVEEAAPRSEQAVTVPIGGAQQPLGYVEISGGPDVASDAVATTGRALLLAGGGALLLAIVLGLLVGRGLTGPLRELAQSASQMSSGDLSTRAPVRGSDEIGELAGQFNEMAQRLETSFAELAAERDALRRFIADASHELRTPITALRSFNELLTGAAAEDPQAQAEFLADSQAQLDRLDWIVANLLDLSRLDAGLVALELAPNDAGELLQSVVWAFQRQAEERHISLVIQPPTTPVQFRCDRARLQIAMGNLVDNALRFTPEDGEIRVGAAANEAAVRLWVRDSGTGIQPEDLPHVFDRFYRGAGSPAAGAGLGLAIAQSVVQAHGGEAQVSSQPGNGCIFAFELPRD